MKAIKDCIRDIIRVVCFFSLIIIPIYVWVHRFTHPEITDTQRFYHNLPYIFLIIVAFGILKWTSGKWWNK